MNSASNWGLLALRSSLTGCIETLVTSCHARGVQLAVALLLSACGDPLVAPELISGKRVLGARVEAVQDPTQAWLEPSERGSVSWLVVGPNGPPALGWSCSLCAAKEVSRGLPRCAGESFAQFTSDGQPSAAPRFEFSMPDESSLAGAEQVALLGAFCVSGTPVSLPAGIDPDTTHCPNPSERPLLASMELSIRTGPNGNHNPTFEAAEFGFDAEAWPDFDESTDATLTCAQAGSMAPSVHAGDVAHSLRIRLPPNLSEPLEKLTVHSPSRETLQLAHFTTAGDLERAYSTVDDAQDGQISLEWTPPRVLEGDVQLVRFYFVLRDGRGGLDWRRLAVCVLP